jgi:hypothetical protein
VFYHTRHIGTVVCLATCAKQVDRKREDLHYFFNKYEGLQTNIILVNLLDSDWLKTVPIKH